MTGPLRSQVTDRYQERREKFPHPAQTFLWGPYDVIIFEREHPSVNIPLQSFKYATSFLK